MFFQLVYNKGNCNKGNHSVVKASVCSVAHEYCTSTLTRTTKGDWMHVVVMASLLCSDNNTCT